MAFRFLIVATFPSIQNCLIPLFSISPRSNSNQAALCIPAFLYPMRAAMGPVLAMSAIYFTYHKSPTMIFPIQQLCLFNHFSLISPSTITTGVI